MVPPSGRRPPFVFARPTPSIGTSRSAPEGSFIVVPMRMGSSCPVRLHAYVPGKPHDHIITSAHTPWDNKARVLTMVILVH